MTTIALDVHVHIIPCAHLAGADGVVWDSESRDLCIDGRSIGPKALFEPMKLLDWMESQRIERSWISVPPPVYRQSLDKASSRLWTQRINRGLTAIADRYP